MRLVLLCYLFFTSIIHAAPVPIYFWHALAGHLGMEITQLAEAFNQSQSDYQVIPVYKGDYIETMTSFAAAFRAGKAPDLVQIYEVGTQTMYEPKGVIKPMEDVIHDAHLHLPIDDFMKASRAFYSDKNKLLALPLNVSVPVLYYNKNALATLGYSNSNFPATYEDLEQLLAKAKQKGYTCGWTSAYPGWILIESFAALHGLNLIDDTKGVDFKQPVLKKHLDRLLRWQSLGYFHYGGRVDEATAYFTSGKCIMFSQSSGAYNSLLATLPFGVGVAKLPVDKAFLQKRADNLIGGAALWAVAGKSQKTYDGIAHFAVFLASPSVQKRWQQSTGYLPIGMAGIYKDLAHGQQSTMSKLAFTDLSLGTVRNHFSGQNQMRQYYDQLLESLFAGMISSDEALNMAENQATHITQRAKKLRY